VSNGWTAARATGTPKPYLGAPGSSLMLEGLQISASARAEVIRMMTDDGKTRTSEIDEYMKIDGRRELQKSFCRRIGPLG